MRGFPKVTLSAVAVLALSLSLLFPPRPASAQLPPGMKPFETHKVADGVYSFRFFFHRNMFVVTDDGVIVTDPMNPKAAGIMLKEIRKVTDKPINLDISQKRRAKAAFFG